MKKKLVPTIAVILLLMFLLPINAAADLLDKDASPAVIASNGSFDTTYKTRMDFSFSGGDLESAAWTVSQSYAGYILTGTTQAGNAISLELTGTQSTVPDSNPNAKLVFNSLNLVLRFRDANNQLIGDEVRYSSGNVQSSPLSYQMGGTVPDNAKTAVISGSFKCRWTTSVVAEESVSVTVELTIEDEPIIAPVETEKQPSLTPGQEPQPGPEQTNQTEPRTEPIDEASNRDPWSHAGPLATVVISIAAVLAAVLGTATGGIPAMGDTLATGNTPVMGGAPATGGNVEGAAVDDKDPAYEKSRIPGYPEYVVGQEGEYLSKLPNGNIQIIYPTGEVATHFPNGDLERMKTPDGSTWEWRSDGTIAEKKTNGNTIIRNQKMDVLSMVSPSGMVVTKHPDLQDAYVFTSPDGGSVVVKTTTEYVTMPNSEGRLERTEVEKKVIEGTIRIENVTWTYKPDGSKEGKHDDGSLYREDSNGNKKCVGANGDSYEEYSDGRVNFKGADGTTLKGNTKTGDVELQSSDGSYIKSNSQTGELDAKMVDGSFWKKDADGNGSFVDKETGTTGECQSNGYCRIESNSASTTHHVDGTKEFRTNNGVVVIQKPDGTENMQLPDGRSALVAPDGSTVVNMPDGTVFQKTPDGQNVIKKPDGSVQNTTQEQFKSELDRYNDWYNKQLESKLNDNR